jgi:hypothetical protein
MRRQTVIYEDRACSLRNTCSEDCSHVQLPVVHLSLITMCVFCDTLYTFCLLIVMSLNFSFKCNSDLHIGLTVFVYAIMKRRLKK